MDELSQRDYQLILQSLFAEERNLKSFMDELARRGLHIGNQQVAIQQRMYEVRDLIEKIQARRTT